MQSPIVSRAWTKARIWQVRDSSWTMIRCTTEQATTATSASASTSWRGRARGARVPSRAAERHDICGGCACADRGGGDESVRARPDEHVLRELGVEARRRPVREEAGDLAPDRAAVVHVRAPGPGQ